MLQSNTRPAVNSFPFTVLSSDEITALYCRLSQDDVCSFWYKDGLL